MSSTFTVGVAITGAVSSSLHSAIGGAQRTFAKLNTTTERLKKSQLNVTQAMQRYGSVSQSVSRNLTRDLSGISQSLGKIERQQKRMVSWDGISKGLAAQRQALTSELVSLGTSSLLVVPAIQAVKGYAGEQKQVTGIARGMGDFSPAFKQHVLDQARKTSMLTAQSNNTILSIMDTLTDAQWKQSDIDKVTTLIGRTATTYNQDASVFTGTAETLSKTFGYTSDQMQHAFNLLAKGGNTVGFELPDLAPALKELGPLLEQSGLKGDEALKQVMAAAGAARKTLAKEDVLPGMQQWLASIDKKNLSARYKAMGVEYEKSRADYAKNGYSDFEASILISQRYLEAKGGKGFAEQFAALGDNAEAQQTLINNLGMGQIFSSPEQIRFLQAMIKNMDTYKKNKEAISKSQDDNYINKNYAEHAKDLSTQFTLLKNSIANTYSVLGQQLAPQVGETIKQIIAATKFTSNWISQHPKITEAIIKILTGLLAFKAGWLVAKIALNTAISPFVSVTKVFISAHGKWLLFADSMKKGGGLYKTGMLISKLTKGGWSLAKVLSGGLVKGLMLAGRAALFLSRALAANPIGLIIMGIAGAAFLIYKYWEPISAFFSKTLQGISGFSRRTWIGMKLVATSVFGGLRGFFSGLWNDIRGLFSGGIGNLAKTIINWSPVGLFYKCFAGVMKYFGIDLPGSFSEFGANIIHGLVEGISATFGKVKDKITGIADSIKDTFKSWLGINSPSTVFMGYGANISEGLAIGIEGKKGIAVSAMKGLGTEIQKQAPVPGIAIPGRADSVLPGGGRAGAGGRAGGDIHLTFSPVINLPGGARAEIRESLRACLPELEAVLRDILYQQQRRSFSAA